MKYLFLFLLFSLTLAEHCHKRCGLHVHKFLRHCTHGYSSEVCGDMKQRVHSECQSMLADAMICLPSLQSVCGLSVNPWRGGEKEDRETEEIFMHGTIHCVMEKFDFLELPCQATPTAQKLRARGIHKRCILASGAYLRDCRESSPTDWSCKFRLTQLLNMGCSEILSDMQTCSQDVEAFCPLPPPRTNPFARGIEILPMPVVMPLQPMQPVPAIDPVQSVEPSVPSGPSEGEVRAVSISIEAPPVAGSEDSSRGPNSKEMSPMSQMKPNCHSKGQNGHNSHRNGGMPPANGGTTDPSMSGGMPPMDGGMNGGMPSSSSNGNTGVVPPGVGTGNSLPPSNTNTAPAPVDANVPSVMVDPIPETQTQPGAFLVGGAPVQPLPADPTNSATTSSPGFLPSTGAFPFPLPFMMPGFPSHHEGKMIRKVMKHCIATHLDDFSPQCQNTKLMQHLRRHMQEDFEENPFGGEGRWMSNQRLGPRGLCTVVTALAFLGICLVWLLRERSRRAELRRTCLESMPAKQGQWTTSLFGSWASVVPDWHTCLPSFLCPQLQTSLNQAEIDDRNVATADVCLNLYKPMMLTNVYRDRQALRAKFDMPEASCEDMLTSVLCTPCAVAQHARELDARLNVAQGNTPLSYVPQSDSADQPQKPITGVPLAEIMKL